MNIVQGDVETRRRTWSLTEHDGTPLIPTAITFVVRGVGGDTSFTTASGAVVNNDDGTGTWTVTAGSLPVGQYTWWAIATVDGEVIVPRDLSGKLTITDR